MKTIQRTVTCRHSVEEMFNIVNDVAKYPEFIPWCYRVEILVNEAERLQSRLFLRQGPLNHSFMTQNALKFPSSMNIQLAEGPFKSFFGNWQFTPINNNVDSANSADNTNNAKGCRVTFTLSFEFSNRLLSIAVSKIFYQLADSLVDLFLKRADALSMRQNQT